MLSTGSNFLVTQFYDSKEFRLAWDNEISLHVAEHAIHLRKLRGVPQAQVAKAMGTSQSALARIEGGDENITLSTLQRLARALRGRIRFAIEPEEAPLPQWPAWWEVIGSGILATPEWTLMGIKARPRGSEMQVVGAWQGTMPAPGLLSLAEAS